MCNRSNPLSNVNFVINIKNLCALLLWKKVVVVLEINHKLGKYVKGNC